MNQAFRITAARVAAFDVLRAVGAGVYLDDAFARAVVELDDRDRRWARECAFGVLRHRGRLDRILEARVHGGTGRLDAPVLDLLRLGAHQILHMDAVPAYAAVSQTVDLARTVAGPGAAGLVNGVLRAVERHGLDPGAFPDRTRDVAGFLSTWHSHPLWLVERWLSRWPAPEVEALLVANNAVPPVYVRPLGIPLDVAVPALGPGAEPAGRGSDCVALGPGTPLLEALARVRGIVQDPGAALVTRYADVPPGWEVADLCAAPGGKAVALAETAAYVVAADRSPERLARVRATTERLGSRVHAVAARAEAPPLRMARAVLTDVPCSGTGTFRRHPDLKWRLKPADLASLAALQRAILDGAAGLVPAGGLLVYSTCTLEPEENEEQVAAFLTRHGGFRLEATDAVEDGLRASDGALVVLPHRTGFDGAYAARLRRVA